MMTYVLLVDHEEVGPREEIIKPLIERLDRRAQEGPFDKAIIQAVQPGRVPDCGHHEYGLHKYKHCCSVMTCRNYIARQRG